MHFIRYFISIQADVAFIQEFRELVTGNADFTQLIVQMEQARLEQEGIFDVVVDIDSISVYDFTLASYQTIFYNLFSGFGFESDIMERVQYAILWFDWSGSTNIIGDFRIMFLGFLYTESVDIEIITTIETVMTSAAFVDAVVAVTVIQAVKEVVTVEQFTAFEDVILADSSLVSFSVDWLTTTFTSFELDWTALSIDIDVIYTAVYETVELNIFQGCIISFFQSGNWEVAALSEEMLYQLRVAVVNFDSMEGFAETSIQTDLRWYLQTHFTDETLALTLWDVTFETTFSGLVFVLQTLVQYRNQISIDFTYQQFSSLAFDSLSSWNLAADDFDEATVQEIVDATGAPSDVNNAVFAQYSVIVSNLEIDYAFNEMQLIVANYFRHEYTFIAEFDIHTLMHIILHFHTDVEITMQRFEIHVVNSLIQAYFKIVCCTQRSLADFHFDF